MNSITNTSAQSLPQQFKSIDDGPKGVENASSFQTLMIQDELMGTEDSRGCHGYANEIDMEAFFAAWGSTDSHFDVDANGIVDGGDLIILLANYGPCGPK